MPTVRQSITVDAEIEISVYCGICGEGICRHTSVDRRSPDTITVTCPKCEETIKEYERIIEKLEEQIRLLEDVE
jgi:hypothetical protein